VFLRRTTHSFLGLLSNDLAIDLGTATTLVFLKGRGIVLCEPSVVAIQRGSTRVLAVGDEAKRMIGRTPVNISAIRPMKDGVIADFDVTEAMLRYFIKKVQPRKINHPRVVVAIPSGITEVEKRAVRDSALRAGAREVYLVEEPKAAAIGVGLPIHEPGGNMIVDIGGGTTEMAVISLDGVVVSKSIRIAGDEMDQAIIEHLRKAYNLMIGERTAEEVKIRIGSAYPLEEELTMEVRGRDLVTGLPKTVTITSEEVREALSEPIQAIVEATRATLGAALGLGPLALGIAYRPLGGDGSGAANLGVSVALGALVAEMTAPATPPSPTSSAPLALASSKTRPLMDTPPNPPEPGPGAPPP